MYDLYTLVIKKRTNGLKTKSRHHRQVPVFQAVPKVSLLLNLFEFLEDAK